MPDQDDAPVADGDPAPMAAVMALLAPGAPFEMGTEKVLGVPLQVFVQRAGSLRELLTSSTRFGDVDYAVFHDGDRRRAVTFTEHERRVASVAAALAHRGIGSGDRVAILAANCPDWLETFLAVVSLVASFQSLRQLTFGEPTSLWNNGSTRLKPLKTIFGLWSLGKLEAGRLLDSTITRPTISLLKVL